ncbi:MAG: universal stress protein [Pseudomonadota bacterium]
MTIKRLLVHVDNAKACPERVRVAGEVARHFDAELIGAYVNRPFSYGYGDAAVFTPELIRHIEGEKKQLCDAAERCFNEVLVGSEFPTAWTIIGDSLTIGLSNAGRAMDLVVIGQHDPDDPYACPFGDIGELCVSAGRPLLVTPYINAPAKLATNIMLAWNGGREAARAAADALPFFQLADRVDVVRVAGRKSDPHDDRIIEYLNSHGINAELHHHANGGIDIGDQLLSSAASLSATMLVMGAYGHSRAREFVLGGATRTILSSMTVPVLLSH